MRFMRDVLAVFQEETGNIYNLEATPAESTAYRFAMLDTKRYPDIITANQADRLLKGAKPYYTNSTHLPVNFTDDLYEALEMQDPLQALYTGGTVFHVFTGESAVSPAAARDMVRRVTGRFRLPYITLSPSFSICPSHGYLSGEPFRLSQMRRQGGSIQPYRRIHAPGKPVERRETGGVRRPQAVRPPDRPRNSDLTCESEVLSNRV